MLTANVSSFETTVQFKLNSSLGGSWCALDHNPWGMLEGTCLSLGAVQGGTQMNEFIPQDPLSSGLTLLDLQMRD